MRLVVLAAAVAVLAGCAACAEPGQVGAGGSSPTLSSTLSPTLSPIPGVTPGSTSSLTAGSKAGATGSSQPGGPGQVTVRGVVQEGVEAGCLLLVAADGTPYLLVGGDPQVVRPGAAVIVRGHSQPGMATTCQQGTPFTVVSAEPDR